jgi:aminopeptidase N
MPRKFLTVFMTLASVCVAQLVLAQQLSPDSASEQLPHHSLKVLLDPANQRLTVEDTITLPAAASPGPLSFSLNRNLTISNNSGTLQSLQTTPNSGINNAGASAAQSNRYSLRRSRGNNNQVLLIYSGTIYDAAEQSSEEYAQSFAETSGIIGEQGVYLSKGSIWIPEFGDSLITFDLQVEFVDTAASWTAVSQGERVGTNAWTSDQPMEEVYLIAADFTEYSQQAEDVEVLAYLRQPDRNLAAQYMDATERYLQLYEPLLGDYPYGKFALVENFWETGYGMPSFTLLGEQVIRFPFILESSFPHEILHNWWGNGVYPDYESGNWSEGLTAYLADHLFQEMSGAGPEYRKEMLARYKNYVAAGADFPLNEFTSRNSAASQAVGYGKTLMLWHMLRIELGNDLFLAGLRKFYSDYKFQRASFADIAALFSELSGRDLTAFFAQWVDRTGAPELSISVEAVNGNKGRIMFAQIQEGAPYNLRVPVALFYAGEAQPQIFDVNLSQKLEGVMADDYERLQAVLVDPYFDVFRQLAREETPPTIGELFGASEIAFVLPDADRQHWTRMAEAFAPASDSQASNSQILLGSELEALPADRSVWILGRDNPFVSLFGTAAQPYAVAFSETAVALAGDAVDYANRSTVLVARHPANPELAIGWIHVDDMIAMPGMIEKLPHYGKYSYLSFLGDEPSNDVKGVWSSSESPLQWIKPDLDAAVALQLETLPVTAPLTTLPPKYLPEHLLRHAQQLTQASMQGRGLGSTGLDEAARYIAGQFRAAGLQTLGGTYLQEWSQLLPGRGATRMANVVGMIAGSNRALSSQPVVLAAHFDHLGVDANSGSSYPGADDNASGVSILLEVASRLSRVFTPQRPILFVAFTGEESGLLGSDYFVNNPGGGFQTKDIAAMINLDSVGRLGDNTLQVFGTDSAYEWPFMAQGIGFTIGVDSTFPSQTIASSDHVSFLNAGIPALHLFSGAHVDYHRASDTADKLDAAGMSDIALWVEEAMVYLGDLDNPLRVTLQGVDAVARSGTSTAREASLGTVPDFAFTGAGVGISAVTPNSAAAAAGLRAGDVLLTYDGAVISDLQAYSDLLRQSAPGDIVQLQIQREAEVLTLKATLKSR